MVTKNTASPASPKKDLDEKTKLQSKQDRDTLKSYAYIRAAIANTAKSLAVALRDFQGREFDELDENEQRAYRREQAKHAKIAVKQIEKTNKMHIFLFKSTTGNWWKIGGNSIAIYRLMIGTYLDREVKVNVDRDNFAVFQDGVICLQNENRLSRDIEYSGAKLELDPAIDFGPFRGLIYAYRLKVPLADREIRRFRKIEEEALKNINSTIFTIAPDVELNNRLTSAMRECYQLERQIDSNARSFVGHQLLDSVFKMRRAYYDVANSFRRSNTRAVAMRKIDEYIGDAMTILSNYADLNIANRSSIVRVSLELAKARELVRQKINQAAGQHKIEAHLEDMTNERG